MFCNSFDKYYLVDGYMGSGGFEDIGFKNKILPIEDFMTYDEIKLAALLSISSRSIFINNGSRNNHGSLGKPGSYVEEGIIIGQVGPRFQKPEVMEFIDCVITEKQNTVNNGYGPNIKPSYLMMHEWANLWGLEYLPTWSEVSRLNNIHYKKLSQSTFLNVHVYKERIKITIEIMITEAICRSSQQNKRSYIHVVGLGLGVWKISDCQHQLFVDTWGDVLKTLNPVNAKLISDINFSWIPVDNCQGVKNGEKFPDTDITIHFSKRNLHDCVPENTLLICNYAWDGNSLPGNEYWTGSLSSTSDSAAACSSCITELHNHFINRLISAENLHVVTEGKVKHISEYAKKRIENKN